MSRAWYNSPHELISDSVFEHCRFLVLQIGRLMIHQIDVSIGDRLIIGNHLITILDVVDDEVDFSIEDIDPEDTANALSCEQLAL